MKGELGIADVIFILFIILLLIFGGTEGMRDWLWEVAK